MSLKCLNCDCNWKQSSQCPHHCKNCQTAAKCQKTITMKNNIKEQHVGQHTEYDSTPYCQDCDTFIKKQQKPYKIHKPTPPTETEYFALEQIIEYLNEYQTSSFKKGAFFKNVLIAQKFLKKQKYGES